MASGTEEIIHLPGGMVIRSIRTDDWVYPVVPVFAVPAEGFYRLRLMEDGTAVVEEL